MIRALRLLLHQHWPENPTCRSGIVLEVCRCGQARYVHLWHTRQAVWATPWTHDPEERRQMLATYSRDCGIAVREGL